jgi:hypothetical protein
MVKKLFVRNKKVLLSISIDVEKIGKELTF